MYVKRFQKRWQWEVCKMFMYMMFPVGCFHYFNTPQIYEEEITKIKQQRYPKISSQQRKEVENQIQKVNAKRELRELEKLEASRGQKAMFT